MILKLYFREENTLDKSRLNTGDCTAHFIREEVLRKIVLNRIFAVTAMFYEDITTFMELIQKQRFDEAEKDMKRKQCEVRQARKRIAELDRIFKRIYEDDINGTISHERFLKLSAEYEAEQKNLRSEIAEFEKQVAAFEESTANAEQFLALAKKYTDFSELTTPMINEFVDKILVHAPEKVDGDRVQEVEIYLNFIGYFAAPASELTPEEEKRQEYLRKHRMQSRERYKALRDGTRKVGEPFQIVCKCCGKTFESKMSNAMFCNQNCRSKYYRQEAAKKRKRECTCGNCGTVFITDRNGVKYCCEDCMKEAAYKRQKERRAAKKNKQKSIEASAIKESDQKGKTA